MHPRAIFGSKERVPSTAVAAALLTMAASGAGTMAAAAGTMATARLCTCAALEPQHFQRSSRSAVDGIPRAMVKTAHPEQKASSAKTQPKKAPPMKTQRTQSWEATAKYVSGQMYQLSRGRPVITGR